MHTTLRRPARPIAPLAAEPAPHAALELSLLLGPGPARLGIAARRQARLWCPDAGGQARRWADSMARASRASLLHLKEYDPREKDAISLRWLPWGPGWSDWLPVECLPTPSSMRAQLSSKRPSLARPARCARPSLLARPRARTVIVRASTTDLKLFSPSKVRL